MSLDLEKEYEYTKNNLNEESKEVNNKEDIEVRKIVDEELENKLSEQWPNH